MGGQKGQKKEYTEKIMLEAVKDSYGVISTVAERLNCSWSTADKYIKQYESVVQAISDERETILDLAESRLFEAIDEGDTHMIKYLLQTKGRNRGYNEKTEIEMTGEFTPIQINIQPVKPTKQEDPKGKLKKK